MMSKRMVINYLLLVLIIIFTWVGNKYPIRDDQLIKRNAITLLKPQTITRMRIETADQTIQLEKQGNSWRLLSPINWFANNIAAERLTTLASVEPQSTLPKNDIDLSTLGLRIPRAVVTLNDDSVYFGDTNRIGNRRYLMVEPNVYLASDIHYAFISQGLHGLTDNRLLPSALPLTSLQLPGLKLSKQPSGWGSESGDRPAEKAAQLILNWQQSQASSIKTHNESLAPIKKIRAGLEDGKQIEFYLLSIKPEIIIARPDLKLQYHFPDHQYYELLAIKADQPPSEPVNESPAKAVE